ncbi:MAG: TauD/TfdA dioxygenase family protein [Acidimicrobiales bacterium]
MGNASQDTAAALDVAPLTGTVGAVVSGVNLATELDDGTVAAIRQALLDHHVVFFRGQDLSPERQIAFGRRFGELDTHPFVEGMDSHPEVIEIITEPDDPVNFGGGWHTDVTFLEEPDLGSILYAVEVPPFGGDTIFADQHAAYDALSDPVRSFLGGLVARHSAGGQYAPGGYSTLARSMRTKNADRADTIVEHPVVRTHPESGRKALYVNPAFTVGIKGLRPAESAALLAFLFEHTTKEAFTCRFRWEPGSVAMWDNRSVQHYALHDYRGQRRRMRRITIKGDRPY